MTDSVFLDSVRCIPPIHTYYFVSYMCCSILIDGTTNFAHGYPSFAVSVGVLFRGNPAAAAVVLIT
jgi:hypothetical protein